MNGYFGYTRVSTVRQGEGVSLEAQHEAISTYATKHGLNVIAWFEEKETAAKQGRPVFSKMLAALQTGEADGLIIHKIDRSARNHSDWALINEMLDSGIDVRFAHESLDLRSRGGRLTADIQAVIAADYVRNLREECIKGIEARLKQGLYPFKAPIGYLDQGSGQAKILDPERAPYVRQAFELYASERYSLRGLLAELNRRGFRNSRNQPITKGCFENLLNNPFYHGVIQLKRTGRTYQGIHEPIIAKALYDRVQAIKGNKHHRKVVKHDHAFRRIISCGHCGHSLCGEKQKGRVYMRCQQRGCPTTTIREDRLDAEIQAALRGTQLNPRDHARLKREMNRWLGNRTVAADKKALELQLSNSKQREDQLTDALLDGLIDNSVFQARKDRLAEERANIEKNLAAFGGIDADHRLAEKFLELCKSVALLYEMADLHKKRLLAKTLFSNRTLTGKYLYLEPQKWLSDPKYALFVLCGPPHRDTDRIKSELAATITELTTELEDDKRSPHRLS